MKEFQQFLQMYLQMRAMQARYFATHDKKVLSQSKAMEKDLDALARHHLANMSVKEWEAIT